MLLLVFVISDCHNNNKNNMDIKIDIHRGRSIPTSTKGSRKLLVYSNVYSISYVERIKALRQIKSMSFSLHKASCFCI